MSVFNESIFDLAEDANGGFGPLVPSTAQPEPSLDPALACLAALGSIIGLLASMLSIVIGLRRYVALFARIFERLVYVFEALTWRAGSGNADDASQDVELSAREGRCLTDDQLLALRSATTQCKELRPCNEYI